jgi:hypothetical protein
MIYNNDRDPNIINWEDENWGDKDKLIRQEVEEMLKDVAATDGDYKTGYKQAILNVLSLLDYYNKK